MSTYTQIVYHLVFGTKNKEKTLTKTNREELYKYIFGICRRKNCHLYRIGGTEDHIHIVTHLHPNVALSELVKEIKIASTLFAKEKKLFPHFKGWQSGYGAFTYNHSAKDELIEFVINQEEYHRINTFEDEYLALLKEHNVEVDMQYFK